MAIDYFLKLDGIDGESTDSRHRNEIVVLSWRWGKAGPLISKAAAAGRRIATAVLSARRGSGRAAGDFFTITMRNGAVVAVQDGGDVAQMAQQVSLQMEQIDIAYRPQGPSGALGAPVAMAWNIRTNVVT